MGEIIGPKTCGGGLTAKDFNLGLPKRMSKDFNKISLHTPFSTTLVETAKPIVSTIDRKDLGQWMVKQAKKAGALIETKTDVSEIKQNSIVANGQEIKFKYLVGADGSTSLLRKSLGLKSSEVDVAIQYEVPKIYKNMEIFLDSQLFASGYAWIFPHHKYTSIGACVDPHYLNTKKLKNNFSKWLKKMKIDVSKATLKAAPINYSYEGYKFKNKYLVGDAAGFASGLTGEGIYFAIISGREVAKHINDKKYKSKEIERILHIKKHHEMLLKLFEFSGPLKNIEYEGLAFLMKSKLLKKELLELYA